MRGAADGVPKGDLLLFFHVALKRAADGNGVGAPFAERRFLVTNLFAAGPKKEPRSGGQAFDFVAASIAANGGFRFLGIVLALFRLRDGAAVDVTPEGSHGVKYIETTSAIETPPRRSEKNRRARTFSVAVASAS